jgi:hypothetical protein
MSSFHGGGGSEERVGTLRGWPLAVGLDFGGEESRWVGCRWSEWLRWLDSCTLDITNEEGRVLGLEAPRWRWSLSWR